MERHALSFELSVTGLEPAEREREGWKFQLAGLGKSRFPGGGVPGDIDTDRSLTAAVLPDLPGAAAEIKGIARLFANSLSAVDGEASEDRLFSLMGTA